MADKRIKSIADGVISKFLGVSSSGSEVLFNFNRGAISNVDANTIKSLGAYYLTSNITNAREWSYLLVIPFGSDVVQVSITNKLSNLMARVIHWDNTTLEWKSI